jgi:hypothetical protein
MPNQFTPRFSGDADDCFTRGYLAAAEWLARDEDGDDLTPDASENAVGWAEDALAEAIADCKAFQEANNAEIGLYQMAARRSAESAGHDFYLSRNGHGAGFFDRGDHPVFAALQDAASQFGGADSVLCEDGFYRFL